ncbi:MAG: class I mannose-6-phosphate isomerase [Pirellulales bacterium]|nr:class I mannose-6-phosphate isomerase [Pirellulales bacterium]
MPRMYPLRFEPLLRRYLWGGRRLASELGKELPPGDDYAESWELCDRGDDQTRVARGPLAGKTLGELVRESGPALLGRHHPQTRFPLLFKFLDAQQTLSVQVHPDDARAARLIPPDLGKTEAWVVLSTKPGAVIYSGLKRGFDRAALAREVNRGTSELCLHRFEPRPGDCVFIPAGAVHALGAGLLIAEIQQASDTTYRLYDWNRVGADGRPRPLHIEAALDAIDFGLGPIDPVVPRPTAREQVENLVRCDKFIMDRLRLSEPLHAGGDDRCHLLVPIEGQMRVAGDPVDAPVRLGETILVPAEVGEVLLEPCAQATLLDIYLP